jgi:hypothetical protein
MTETPVSNRRKLWPWIVGGIVVLILVGAGAFTLGKLTAPGQQPEAGVTPLATAPPTALPVAPTPIATPTPVITPTPVATEAPAGPKLTADELDFYRSAVSSGNTAVLVTVETASTKVKIAGQDCCGHLGPDAAVNKLSYVTASDPKWNYAISSTSLAKWRAGEYAEYFPVNAVVGHSSDGSTFSFVINAKRQLVAIFMAKGDF